MAGKITALPSKSELFGKKPSAFRPLPPAPPPAAEVPTAPLAPVIEAPPAILPTAQPETAPVIQARPMEQGSSAARSQESLPPNAQEAPADQAREKFTFRFDTATLQDLDEAWMKLRRRTGQKIRKSWIVEALVRHGLRNPEQTLEILRAEMTSQMGKPS